MTEPIAPRVAIIGGGPAGLMAAEALSGCGIDLDVYDAMPSVGRKFLMAGKGGMNITHAEPFTDFCTRYGTQQQQLRPLLEAFGPNAVREWMRGLGIDHFVGSSGRVFPVEMKAAPLLRAWLHRLRAAGVKFHLRHRWNDIAQHNEHGHLLNFTTPDGPRTVKADAVVFALGGGSWPQLGSDAAWISVFSRLDIPVAPLRPANCGFTRPWSAHLRDKFAGQPVKNIVASFTDVQQQFHQRAGELMITAHGVEGGLIYALSAPLRDAIASQGEATLHIDLLPDRPLSKVIDEIARPRGARSLATHLQSRLGIKGVKAALLYECLPREAFSEPETLGQAIKALPLRLESLRPLEEAISSAGGVQFEALDSCLMLNKHPGVFCAGEMLDWEAPTGGYLLTACLATGLAAGQGARAWLQSRHDISDSYRP